MTDLREALTALANEWDARQPRYGAHREAQAYEDGIVVGFEAAAEELRKLLAEVARAAGSVETCDGDGRCTNPRCQRHGITWNPEVAGSVGAGEDGTVTP